MGQSAGHVPENFPGLLEARSDRGGCMGEIRQTMFRIAMVPVALGGIALCLLAALNLPPVQKFVIKRLKTDLSHTLNATISVAGYHVWPWSAGVEGLTVDLRHQRILDCRQVDISFNLNTTYPYLRLDALHFMYPVMRLERDQIGKWRLPLEGDPGVNVKKSSGRAWPMIRFPLLYIEHGRIEAEDAEGSRFVVEDVTGKLRVRVVEGPEGPELGINIGS